MAENQLEGEVLGVSWDGTGYGLDGTIWGGEFLLATKTTFERVATFRPFRLPGGEKAIKEPRRTALGMLYELFGDDVFRRRDLPTLQAFAPSELELINQVLLKRVNAPVTTSVGRIFDAVASLIGLQQRVNYEGQAAMELEFLIAQSKTKESYAFTMDDRRMLIEKPIANLKNENQKSLHIIDWSPFINGILEDVRHNTILPIIATKFHNTLVEIIIAVAKKIGQPRVVLSGGCFQNRYLTERAVKRLQEEEFRPYWHQRVPPNDGGIALGQLYAALRSLNANRS
jgi:hydrogenase maturation protein HypF